jgi:hypothetical protein
MNMSVYMENEVENNRTNRSSGIMLEGMNVSHEIQACGKRLASGNAEKS